MLKHIEHENKNHELTVARRTPTVAVHWREENNRSASIRHDYKKQKENYLAACSLSTDRLWFLCVTILDLRRVRYVYNIVCVYCVIVEICLIFYLFLLVWCIC